MPGNGHSNRPEPSDGHDGKDGRGEPELPPPTAGTPPSCSPEPAFRLGSAWPYIGAVVSGIGLVLVVGLVFIAKPMATSAKAEASGSEKGSAAGKTRGEASKPAGAQFVTDRKPAKAGLPRAKTAVLVLNGTGNTGAAQAAAGRLRDARYQVVGADTAAHPDFRRTLVLYRRGFRGEAERLSRDLGLGWRRVSPVDGMKRKQLGEARLVLILGG